MLLHYEEFSSNVEENRYKINDLRSMIKQYNIKTKYRRKVQLIEAVYLYLRESFYVMKIQKVYRGHLHRKLLWLKGEGWKAPEKCLNDTDFYTLDTIKDIPAYEFFSFKDNEQLYGVSVVSLFKLLLQTNGKTEFSNPYNRNTISRTNLADSINCYIRICRALKIPIDFYPEVKEQLTQEQIFRQRVSKVFMAMDELGNYTQEDWFLNISNSADFIIFLRELYDIWSYRAQLTSEVKMRISNSTNLFTGINFGLLNTNVFTGTVGYERLMNLALTVMERFVFSAINTEDRVLGAIYVLSALTLVSSEAAAALPWLHSSVTHHDQY
mgnify:CR=1 FL=1